MRNPKPAVPAAFGDFDNDGDLDVLVMNMSAPVSLLRNDLSAERHWVRFRLQGTRSNHSAIGALVTIKAGESSQSRAVMSQSSYVSHNDLRVHFGLGQAATVDSILVRWPSGAEETFPGVEADADWLLVEGSGAAKAQP